MLFQSRHDEILEMLSAHREIDVQALSEHFNVSKETIRRDLRSLEEQGKLRRVYGGAISATQQSLLPVIERVDIEHAAKSEIAALAVQLIEPGQHVFFGGSSTTLIVAEQLAADVTGNFCTNMIDIALLLAGRGQQVTLLGGAPRISSRTLVGPETISALQARVFDISFCGVSALDLERGVMGPTEWHGISQRILREQSKKLVLVADHTKFGRTDRFREIAYREIDILVTDRKPSDEFLKILRDARVDVRWPTGRSILGAEVSEI